MQWLAEVCVKRPVFAWVMTLMIMVLGMAGYSKLGVDRFPKIDFPFVTVTTILPGASAEDMETDVSDKIEGAVSTIGDIDELRSISAEGLSLVFVQFRLEKDLDAATQEVRDKLALTRKDLPDDIESPVVTKIDPAAAPILYASVSAPGRTLTQITEFSDKVLRPTLEVIPGVGEVKIVGGRERTIQVLLDPVKLRSMGVSVGEVARAIGIQNVNVPVGSIDTGRDLYTLRVNGRVERPSDIADIAIRTVVAGGRQPGTAVDRVIRVADVATVKDTGADVSSTTSLNGASAVILTVRKQSGGNTVAVAEAVRERIEELTGTLPDGYAVDVLRDESASIRTGTEGVKEHLVVGALLAALVVFAFLGSFRSTVIAALAIPTSIVGTFALMALMGYTLNTITLLALALAVGIVIDDAIVVLENIYRFVEEKGMSPAEAAVAGTKDIGLAVLATTFSLIAVFMPVAFLAGIPGRFLSSFGVTMSFAIAVSLFVSFSLTPMLASRWLKAKPHGAPPAFGERVVNTFYRPIERAYMAMLRFAMRRRWVIVLLCFLTMASLPFLASIAKKGFLPVDDRAQFEVTIRAPEGTSIASTAITGERIAAEIRAMPEVSLTLVTTGANDQGEDNVAQVYVRLVDPKDRAASQDQLMDRVRNEVLAHQDAKLQLTASLISDIGGTGNSNARIQYNLTGPDLGKLQEYADKIVVELKKVKGAVDASSSFVAGKPEVALRVDRGRAADLGISVLDVASTLQMMVSGVDVGRYAEGGKQYTIRMRGAPEFRDDPGMLGLIPVMSPKAGLVALTDLVTMTDGTGPATINRLNRMRNVTISANAAPGVGDNIVQDAIVKIAADLKMPPEYHVSPAGQAKIMKETAQAVLLGFALAFVFMYLILAAQFESWLHPFTILLSLPLTLPFAVLSIVLTGQALDMFSVLGIFVLFGIVKKNAILQIDHTNNLRAEGMPRLEAILQANKDRLRPILMTTVAFVAGMIPLVTSKGIGSGFNQATAGVVVGGQTFSLLLTLIATPVVYSLFDDVLIRIRAWMIRFGLTQPDVEPLEPGVTEERG